MSHFSYWLVKGASNERPLSFPTLSWKAVENWTFLKACLKIGTFDQSKLKRPCLIQCKVDFYSYLNPQKALLIDGRGRLDEVSCFENDSNAEVHRSCSLTWHNGFYVFGGRSNKRQISQVKGTRLTSIGTLTFDHYIATCDVMAGEKIFLCFNFHSNDSKRCRLALSPLGTFSQIQQSSHAHRSASIAASECK